MSPATRARPMEVELKYRVVRAAAGDRYLDADELAGFKAASPVRSTQVEDRYLDTADGAMARAGFATRLRQTAKGTTVAVKSAIRRVGTSNVHRREELEGPADRTASPRDWPASDARSLILELCGDAPLVELVTIRQLRRKRELVLDGTRVELSLDEVDAVARSRVVERFVELEVELLKGSETKLAAIDALLSADSGLVPARTSKLEAALRAVASAGPRRSRRDAQVLPIDDEAAADDGAVAGAAEVALEAGAEAAGSADAAIEADSADGASTDSSATDRDPAPAARSTAVRRPTRSRARRDAAVAAEAQEAAEAAARPRLVVGKTAGVLADDHVAEAGRKVLRFHLARMIAREPGTRDGSDPEDLHAMRVATRRQRAAWRVFGGAFRAGRTKRYRGRLCDVAARLGGVRDLDVLLDAADAYRADLPTAEQRALEPLLAGWRTHRDDARVLLLRELDSEGYRRWLDDYAEFVRHEGVAVEPVAPNRPHHVRDTAASRIQAAYEEVRAYEPILRWADVETLHDLRIAAKWLRYSIEFVREPLAGESDGLIARVVGLQDHLGLLQDAEVTARMTRSFLVERAGSLSSLETAAIGRYLVHRERAVSRLQRSVGVPWRRVAGIAFRRSLGRTLAGL